jgi:hypothetical protein
VVKKEGRKVDEVDIDGGVEITQNMDSVCRKTFQQIALFSERFGGIFWMSKSLKDRSQIKSYIASFMILSKVPTRPSSLSLCPAICFTRRKKEKEGKKKLGATRSYFLCAKPAGAEVQV